MLNHIAFVDPFVQDPAIHCFNDFVSNFHLKSSYHMPSKFGTRTLEEVRSQTRAYIVVGSASHVTEPLEWHRPLATFLLEELNLGKPILGCCFGHQLLCHALGSTVEFAFKDQEKHSGVRSFTITQDFWNFKKNEVFTLPVTHRQLVTSLGKGLKAVGIGLPQDLVVHETLPFLSTQAHPEASSYFCQTDVQKLAPNEVDAGRKDGQRLIRRFLEHFQLA